jgi:endonuclease G
VHPGPARRGYDPRFLPDVELPLPRILPTAMRAGEGGGARELRYEHFSLVTSPEVSMPLVAAVNIRPRRREPESGMAMRAGRVRERTEFPASEPLSPTLVLARLTRDEDAAWGDHEEMTRAFVDTAQRANLVVQHARLPERAMYWFDIEDVLGVFSPQGLTVLQGPILRADDPVIDGVAVPVRFWKIVAWQSSRGLRALGIIVSQQRLLERGPDADIEAEQWRASIPTIASEADLVFPEELVRADTFKPGWERLHPISGWLDILDSR